MALSELDCRLKEGLEKARLKQKHFSDYNLLFYRRRTLQFCGLLALAMTKEVKKKEGEKLFFKNKIYLTVIQTRGAVASF